MSKVVLETDFKNYLFLVYSTLTTMILSCFANGVQFFVHIFSYLYFCFIILLDFKGKGDNGKKKK